MNKIKTKLIHLLGGKTKEDLTSSFMLGRKSVLLAFKYKMEAIYGCDSDEWCKDIYALTKKLWDSNQMYFDALLKEE